MYGEEWEWWVMHVWREGWLMKHCANRHRVRPSRRTVYAYREILNDSVPTTTHWLTYSSSPPSRATNITTRRASYRVTQQPACSLQRVSRWRGPVAISVTYSICLCMCVCCVLSTTLRMRGNNRESILVDFITVATLLHAFAKEFASLLYSLDYNYKVRISRWTVRVYQSHNHFYRNSSPVMPPLRIIYLIHHMRRRPNFVCLLLLLAVSIRSGCYDVTVECST